MRFPFTQKNNNSFSTPGVLGIKNPLTQRDTAYIVNVGLATRIAYIGLVLFVAHYLFNIDTNIVGFLLPFFILGSDGGGGGGAGGDAGAGCGAGGCSDSNGGGCCSSDQSTPFICTWNGKKFIFENDFLFGKPNSLFPNKDEGMRMYESGAITPDLYRIQNNITLKKGYFVAQIKEIEPEESYIDHLSLLQITYPKRGELIVDSKFEHIHVFEKNSLEKLEGVSDQRVIAQTTDISHIVGNTERIWKKTENSDGIMLEPNDSIEISGRVEHRNQNTYLLLRAHYRDWTAGEIFDVSKKEHYISTSFFDAFSSISPRKVLSLGLEFIRSILAIPSPFVEYWSNKTANVSALKNQQHSVYLPLPPW